MIYHISAHPQAKDILTKFLRGVSESLDLNIDMNEVEVSIVSDKRWVKEMIAFKEHCPEIFREYKPEADSAPDFQKYLEMGLDDDEGGTARREPEVTVKGTKVKASLRDMFTIEQGYDG